MPAMPPSRRRRLDWVVMLLQCGTRVRRLLPREFAIAVAKRVGDACWLLLRTHRRIIRSNLARTAAIRPPGARRRLCRATFRNLAVCTSDVLALSRASPSDVLPLGHGEGREHLDAALGEGRGAILATAHAGNLDLGAAILAAHGYRAHAVVERLRPAVRDWYTRHRSAVGVSVIPRGNASEAARAALASGAVLAVVADRVIGHREGRQVPFAGGVRTLPTGPAKLALATGAPLLVASFLLDPDADGHRYRYTIQPRIPVADLGTDPVGRLTDHIAAGLSRVVLSNPDQWFVFQPGWLDRDDPWSSTARSDSA